MYLLPRLSVEVQRGNAASVLGTTTPTSSTDYFLFMYTYYLLASTCMCAPYVLLLLSLIS